MKQLQLVLSPCGTSILTNKVTDEERKLLNKNTNTKTINEIPEQEANILRNVVNLVKEELSAADPEKAAIMSAELNAIIKLYEGKLQAQGDIHILLCTDTWLGEQTANLVKEWLEKYKLMVQIHKQTDLRTINVNEFQSALTYLVKWCEETLTGYRESNYKIIFNLTGGFKSIQGFLQTLAMLYADESIYVFETGKELLRLPRLPLEMLNPNDIVRKNFDLFRKFSLNLPVENISSIPETLLIKIDDQVGLSIWGDSLWKKSQKAVYSKELWPSPSTKIRYGKNFSRSVKGLSPDRFCLVNEKIDQLAKYLESNGTHNPPSLDFKPLKGNPKPPSTHEMDAWADQDAKRIFGHFEEDDRVFVLDELNKALH